MYKKEQTSFKHTFVAGDRLIKYSQGCQVRIRGERNNIFEPPGILRTTSVEWERFHSIFCKIGDCVVVSVSTKRKNVRTLQSTANITRIQMKGENECMHSIYHADHGRHKTVA